MRSLVIFLSLLLAAWPARAIYQFYIRVEDMAVIDCWNPATCAPYAGSITLVNEFDESEIHVIPCDITMGLSPYAYQFTADVDSLVANCEDVFEVVEQQARFCGPGFGYLLSRTPFIPYSCGLHISQRLIPTSDSGCDVSCGQPYWTCYSWEEYPSGVVLPSDDLIEIVPHPSTRDLCIDPGMRLHFQPGKRLIVAGPGALRIQGTPEAPITLSGENWGGVELREGARLELRHVRITGVSSEGDGGALVVGPGSEARLTHCIVDHNACAGAGGAAVVRAGGLLVLDHCTVADNTGGTAGGVFLAAPNAQFESNQSILAHSLPAGTELTGAGFAHEFATDFFPQTAGFPPNLAPPVWTCEPGFVDRAAGDYRLTWLAPDSSAVNCVVDVVDDPLQLDPDGTPGDLGALPLDQRLHLLPPRQLTVEDWPGDEGGWVRLRFQAAPQDGTPLGPVLGYSLWMRPPGEPVWLALGFLAATGDPEAWLETRLPTWRDATEADSARHEFRVAVHALQHPAPAFAPNVSGASRNDLPPPAVTHLVLGDWYYDAWPPTMDCLDVHWNEVDIEDPGVYQARASLTSELEHSHSVYEGILPDFTYCVPLGTLEPGQPVWFWVRAVDGAGNAGPWVETVTLQFPLSALGDNTPGGDGLAPAWPNPFNPLTRIRYHLGASGPVRLTAWNAAGQRVAVLVEGDQAAGAHELVFDGRGLASGVYYIRLEAAGHAWTERLLLLR